MYYEGCFLKKAFYTHFHSLLHIPYTVQGIVHVSPLDLYYG